MDADSILVLQSERSADVVVSTSVGHSSAVMTWQTAGRREI